MSSRERDIAVVGMSGKFPGADGIAELWRNLCAGTESIVTLSDEQLRVAGVSDADLRSSSYVRAAALLNDVELFDPGFFKIAPLEAELMDPQMRLLLQCAWEALEDAGHATPEAQNIGVFAGAGGVTTSYFANFVNVDRRFEKITAGPAHLGNDKDFVATYISYKLNLTGPSVTVQTACSTSLVALHQARMSLLNGECDMALAGGVTVRVPHALGYHYREGYIFSRSGHIRAFDEGADGVVFGSGLGLVLIKRLSDAIRDGNRVYAVIKGSAITNDGKGKMSYAASSAKGQIACINSALRDAGIRAEDIGLVETHGTGTSMGDPEEVKALSAAFKAQTDRKGYCALGAIKSNVGHLEAAAGITGFIKAALAVERGVIPPLAHYSKPNPRIRFENTPFYVNTAAQQWSSNGSPRRAAVNSLGVGGTNAFVILEEYVPAVQASVERSTSPVIVPISAKSPASLDAYVRKLADHLAAAATANTSIDIGDLAYTLQVGREPMDRRVAFVASSVEELQSLLRRHLDGLTTPGHDVFLPTEPSDVEREPPDIQATIEARDLNGLAQFWVDKFAVAWEQLYANARQPQRIHLPTYVFAKDRCWIDAERSTPARAVLHPLLHINTSDLNEQKYTSTFDGNEFFLNDHLVRAADPGEREPRLQKILPGVAYLEMARAAIERAVPAEPDARRVVELRNVIWVQPLAVAQPKQVDIVLLSAASTVDFEVYGDGQSLHCQGQASFVSDQDPAALDIAALGKELRQGQWSAEQIYSTFDSMGLCYGPAHRALARIDRGERQLLAHLKMPDSVAASQSEFTLHPSMMDGVLQATIGVLFDLEHAPADPEVPFAVDQVRVLSPCTSEMVAWVRHAPSGNLKANLVKLDIDLCEPDGKICVQLRGFASRSLSKSPRANEETIRVLAAGEWQPAAVSDGTEAVTYAQRHLIVCGLPRINLDALAGESPSRQVLRVSLDDRKSLAERYTDVTIACFERVQAILRSKPQSKVLVQLVAPSDGEESLVAGLTGLLKTARLENPQLIGQVVLVAAGTDAQTITSLLSSDECRPGDALIKHDLGARYVFGWRAQQERGSLANGGAFKSGGVYLLTGGLGGLGALFAKEILSHVPDARIVVTGRLAASDVERADRHRTTLESLRALGAAVEYRQLNLDDSQQVAQTIASICQRHERIDGILHCAGMVADSFILKKHATDLRQVLAPKVQGTDHLDQATQHLDLDFFALFSSLTSAVGNAGQADYAAANGFMDQFAGYRNRLVTSGQRRGRTVAIHWPFWQDGGMQLDASGLELLHETTGVRPLATATGMQAFYESLASDRDELLPMEGDPAKIQHTLRTGLAVAEDRVSIETEREVVKSDASASQPELLELTQSYLCRQLSVLLKVPAHKVHARAPLEDYGIDSILALSFTRVLEKDFGSLPKTLFFEYLTICELAGYFVGAHAAKLGELFSIRGSTPAPRVETQNRPQMPAAISKRSSRRRFAEDSGEAKSAQAAVAHEPIAIIGLSGRYPQSRDLDAFWDNLRTGRDCIVEVPPERWDWREYYSDDRTRTDRHFSKWGGFIEGVDEFDPRFFNISPREAATIDPQERLFLQHCWMAVEDAGYTRERLQIPRAGRLAGQVGVYAGVMYGEYNLSGSLASIANRVSYVLNLHGPSITLDTMCSSSLTAIHLACQDLKHGRTDLAIAGGVNISIHPNKYLMLSTGQFISGDGHCQSFGEGGDGYIPAEGVGVVILKRLSEARRDGDHIYGIIRGSSVNHGGKTNGYTVPNPQAQAGVIGDVLLEAQVDARHISYLEAHGTGTKLGDPIEIAALSKAFQRSTQDTGFCLIGSAKSNIGHAESAAGVAGLTKVLLQMKHRQIVPSLHSQRLNPHIEFASTPFVVNQSLREWSQPVIDGQPRPRIAGISSFGAGGANAHLIVEEPAEEAVDRSTQPGEVLIPLSARTTEQLQQKIQDLLAFVKMRPPLQLSELAFTLQTGREALTERLGLVVGSVDDLVARLQSCLQSDEQQVEGIFRGRADSHRDTLSMITADADFEATVQRWIERKKLDKLVSVWVQGFNVDWRKLWADAQPRRISLPTYPFARERYWLAGPAFPQKTALAQAARPTQPTEVALPLSVPASDRAAASTATVAKPTNVILIDSATAPLEVRNVTRTLSRLDAIETQVEPSGSSSVSVLDRGDGVFFLNIDAAATDNALSTDLIEQLIQALADVAQESSLKVLVITGNDAHFLSGGRECCDEAIERGLYRDLASFPAPVIAALQGNASGAGFLMGALCDFMIVSLDGRYAFTSPHVGLWPSADEFHLFSERFGEARATEFLYVSPESTGASLIDSKWGCPALPHDQVSSYVEKLATRLAGMPRESLQLLKTHLAREISRRVAALRPAGDQAGRNSALVAARLPLPVSGRFIRIDLRPEGVLLVTARAVNDGAQALSLVSELTGLFAQLGGAVGYRSVVVASEAGTFLDGLDQAASADAVLKLQQTLQAVRIPVIGALNSGASGLGWLISQYFDLCVYGETGVNSLASLLGKPQLAQAAAAIFPVRFGATSASEIVLTGAAYDGLELKRSAGAVLVAPNDQVISRALDIASAWSRFPAAVLEDWKESRLANIGTIAATEIVEAPDQVVETAVPQPVALASEVIHAVSHPGGILVVTMADRDARNRFSDALIAGMNEVFRHIEDTPAYKVVVLTGFDNYFASGGTKEALLAIQQGTLKYTDVAVFELPLRCELPVIAAMQGHTVGAGWSLGLFCDLMVDSEESIHSTRFMSFGFTPGAASTLVFPHKLGRDLSLELLMTAQEISGRELRERGAAIPMYPRREVLPAAMQLAEMLARRERSELIALKRQLNRFVGSRLDDTYRYELEMQERTFVGQRHVLERIRSSYMQDESDQSMTVVTVDQNTAGQAVADKLAGLTAGIGQLLADELYLRADEIDEHTQFIDLGLDSITGVTWIRKINEKYALSVEATKVYSHPTLAELSRYIRDELLKQSAAAQPKPPSVSVAAAQPDTSKAHATASRPASIAAKTMAVPARQSTKTKIVRPTESPAPVVDVKTPVAATSAPVAAANAPARAAAQPSTILGPIAVVGMAGQFPKAATLQDFWNNIAGGVDCVSVVPRQRWDVDALYQEGAAAAGKTVSKWMGSLENYDRFDPLFFSISPTEAEAMDPQQRLFLQACWHAIEDAGYAARSLSGSKTGVFAGCAAGDYYRDPSTQRLNAQQLMGNAPSILAARISYFLNLQGPCVSVDTACSSSLVALATACDSLSSGASDVALAGGVQVMAGPAMHIMTSQAGMLSPDGRCFTFDERANGFVPAEAVGVVMLKRLADAERDQDFIYGVIRGWGVNQDGKTNGITAPNPESQTRLQQSVYDKYQIDPEQIQLIEAHGTGTKLGDPIEIDGLKAAFGKYTSKTGYCAVGSVKSNMGHALNAAGIAGFIKLMLALKHRQLPPTIHCERINQHIALENSPFYINGELREWPSNGTRLRQAAISSFGFSGTNCHMVVSEAASATAVRSPVVAVLQNGQMPIPLSARTEDQLKQRIVDLLQFIRSSTAGIELQELAYVQQVGRDPMDHRLGVMAATLDELADKLQRYLDQGDAADGCYRGQAKQHKESLRVITQDEVVRDTIIEKYLARGELHKLLQLWTKGFDVDWHRLYGGQTPRRIGMPVYPFAQERYWLESSNVTSPAGASSAGSQLHPLLHRNVSDFSEQSYVTELTGTEPFLADHRVAGKKVLPGVAYLEMARAAITDATGGVPEGALTLRNVVWSRPVVVADEPQSLRIALHPKSLNEFSYQITSGTDGSTQQITHGGGEVTFGAASAAPIDIQALRARTSGQQISHERYYRMLEAIGLQYGPSHRRIVEMHVGDGEALARLAPLDSQSSYILHPGLLDAAFHASLAVQDTEQPVPLLPFALEQIEISSACDRCTWAWVRSANGTKASDKLNKLDIDLFDDAGVVSVRVRGLSARAMESELVSEPTPTSATLLLEPVWTEQAAVLRSGAHESIERYLFLCGFDSIALALQRQLSDTTVISLSMTAPTPAERFQAHALQIFECLQRSIERKADGSVLIQVLIPDSDDGELYAGLWSLLQSAHLESSKIVGQLIALDPATPGAEVCARLQENSQCEQTGPIRHRQERRFVRQLAELAPPATVASPWRDGTYLITGGAGGLGLIFAKAIASCTRSTVILTGRSELDEAGRQRIHRLQTNGSRVEYRRVDVTDAEAVRNLLRNIQNERGGLTGILHCAGIIRDSYIARKPSADFAAVLGPKIAGTQHLDEASRSQALDFFVLFSSIGGVLGGAGQADYAVANAFMDGYASYRNRLVASGQRSGRTLSINWPLWQSEGMGVDAAKEAFFKAHFGMLAMPEARGLQAFNRALSSDRSQVMVMDGILQRMRQRLLPGQAAPSRAMAAQPMHEPASHAVTAPDGDMLVSRVRETLRRKVARFLKMHEEALDYDTELTEFGFDSISLTELTNQLNQELELDLTPTVFFEYPTLSGLAAHLSEARRDVFVSTLAPRVVEVPGQSPPPAEPKRRSRFPAMPVTRAVEPADDPIAIIGMSGKFPQAETLEQFWENLRTGRDCIEEVPASRWDWQAVYGDPRTEDNKTNIKWGGFIDGVDEFDPLFFGISPREAQLMDPQQRLLMTYAWKVIEDAGYAPQSLSGSSTGVFVGTYTSGYQELAAQAGIAVDGYFSTGMSMSIGPNRMSYFLNLHGPSEPIETACSSSLVAIHRAVQAIKTGSCEAAIAGGVNAIVNPSNHIAFSKAGMLSPDGRCKTFSNRANGYVRGEGVGMLFLKKLSAAERDGDQILAVIRGSAENHGGRASSLTAPNPKAQASLLQTAYRQAGVDPRTVGYIEAHGTGTELGDPIEINALKSAFQTLYDETSQGESSQPSHAHCALGSLKSNIGHLELAAGVAGVIKVLLQLKHKTRVSTLHCETINPYIDLTGTAFYIARQNDEWPRLKDRAGHEVPRRAGVSSFGFGGVNAHVVIEEYVSARSAPALASQADSPHLIVLSARTESSLAQAVTNLASYLEEEGRTVDLASIAYTLQVGRDGMEQRLAMVVRSREELLDKLRKFASGADGGDFYRGEIKRGQDALSVFAGDEDLRGAVDVWIQKGKYDKLLSLWVKGLELDWNKLYGESRPQRVSLPTYAFARERVWIEPVAGRRQSLPESAASQPVRDSLHPLLHIDTSRPDQQSYRTTLGGTEFFLQDHQVRSDTGAAKPVLPAVAYLEMARAAVEHALRDRRATGVLELHGTTWLQPCIVTAPRELSISLHARGEDASVDFEILSHAAGEASVHCQGWATFAAAERIERFDLEQLRRRINGPTLQPSDIYAALDDMGLNYGPTHRAVAAVQVGDGELLARLKLPATVGLAPYLLHPSLMDGALQASIGFLLARSNGPAQPWVPFALESARIFSACRSDMYAWIRRVDAADSLLKVDIDLFDAQGNACVALRGVSARALHPVNAAPAFDDSLYHRIIDSVMNNELSIDAAVDLG